MIELRPMLREVPGSQAGDLEKVRAREATVYLQVLSDKAIMLIVEDWERHVHLRITHGGRSPLRVWVHEEWPVEGGCPEHQL